MEETLKSFEKIVDIKPKKTTIDFWQYRTDKCFEYEITENNITKLKLTNLYIKTIPEFISEFKHITHLSFAFNQLEELPDELFALKKLEYLDLRYNKLLQINKNIKNLKELKGIYLSDNKIKNIDESFGSLKNLTNLWLSDNEITSISTNIGSILSLKVIYLANNLLKEIPSSFGQLENLIAFDLSGCKNLETPPPEIAKSEVSAKLSYLNSLFKELKLPLNELKIILVGDGGAGKTSLVKRILNKGFSQNEQQTHGINISSLKINIENEDIKIHFWDFGGQEIMHATHQFFLSKRSLYIIVLDGRREEKTEYWLKHVETFGGDSPVIVVINKIDENPAYDVNRKFLRAKYPYIKEFFKISCATNEGVEGFFNYIKTEIYDIKHLKTLWPESWFNVKRRLEAISNDYISFSEFIRICVKNKIENEDTQLALVDFLHDLGIVLYFHDCDLAHTQVLNPRWATHGVYKVINSKELSENEGILELKNLNEILKKKTNEDYNYPNDKKYYIVRLMEKFELCYKLDSKTFLVPDLLDIEEPKFNFDSENALRFIFQYDFFPKSIIPRFIVRMHKSIYKKYVWRTGVFLYDEAFESSATVISDEEEKRIYICVNGNQKRNYFSIIRHTIRDINNTFEKLSVTEKVPLPGVSDIFVDYDELIGHERCDREEIFIGKIQKAFSVTELLDGIENKKERMSDAIHYRIETPSTIQIIKNKFITSSIMKKQVFKNIKDSTIINESLVKKSLNKLKESNDMELALVLEKIAEIIETSNNHAASAIFNKFNEELVSKKSNKTTLKQLWDGLTSILPSISQIVGIGETISKLF